MNNKGLIIALIVLLSIIVVLLSAFLVLNISGKFNWSIGSLNHKSTDIIYDKKFELEDIKNIQIKHDAGDIFFKETSDESIQVVAYGDDGDKISVDVNDNKLIVDYKQKNRFTIFSFGINKNDIIVYLPSNYSNTIKINNDYGNCEVADFENATLNIECDAGNVEIEKAKDITVKCDLGNVEIGEVLNKCDIKVDCGNIKIDKVSIKEDSRLKVDLGNIEINQVDDIYVDADVDLGKANVANNNRNADITLKIDCDCGNIRVGK